MFFGSQTPVYGFDYQFVLTNNTIAFDFVRVQPITNVANTVTNSNTNSNKFLSFSYRLTEPVDLPTDLPLFLMILNDQVFFFADASILSTDVVNLSFDTSLFAPYSPHQLPIFLKNALVDDLKLEISDLQFSDQALEAVEPFVLSDLNLIREVDGSITVIFTLTEKLKRPHLYQLICLNEQEELISSVILTQTDHFLWSDYTFHNLLANSKNELIFHLASWRCTGDAYVIGDKLYSSNRTKVIDITNL
jgi:hypothetical protein